MTGQMTLGDLFMYVFFTGLMAMPVIEIAAIGTQITEAFAGLDRIREILNMPTEDQEDARREALDGVRGDVEFEDVIFEYNEDAPVMKGVSFKAADGTTTAMVGFRGTGKCTVSRLVIDYT